MAADANTLRAYVWENRPLLVFAPSDGHTALKQQRAIVAAQSGGFKDRDMVVIEIVADRVRSRFGRRPMVSAHGLRSRYDINKDAFSVVLVGKDGGQKLKRSKPVSALALFGLIDSMPMRQREMRGGG